MAGYAPTGGAGDLQAEAARCNGEEYFRVMWHFVGDRSVSLCVTALHPVQDQYYGRLADVRVGVRR